MKTHTSPQTAAHVSAMRAPLVTSIPYSPAVRFYDSWWIGRRDADPQLAHGTARDEQPSASLRALDAKLRERCEHERLSAVRIAASTIDNRTSLVRRDAVLRRMIDAWTEQIEQERVVDPAQIGHTAKTEAHLDAAQREGRRQREAAARVAPLVNKRAAACSELDAIQYELADIEGQLTTLFEALQARVAALAHHYERRCSTQIRGYLRRAPGDADHPLNTRVALHVPEWAAGPNPWLHSTEDRAVER